MINTGLYIHIPFCRSKCPYCDFFSVVAENENIKTKYIDALKKEIEIYGQKAPDIKIQSIFFGGGTPTLLKGEEIAGILKFCFNHFKINKNIEITIESNPATFDRKKAEQLFQAGINRLSLGIQSLNNQALKKIGRIHNRNDILQSYQIARKTGFRNINLDIMYGLPQQSLRQFLYNLEEAMQLCPEHISLYGLTIEPQTPFGDLLKKGILRIPSEDTAYQMYQNAINLLYKHGYVHYEISNFSLKGKQCFHNQIYWRNMPYLGLGASATSYLENKRFKNYSHLNQYINLLKHHILPIETKEILPIRGEMAETVILNLRMMQGLAKDDFMDRFKKPVENIFYEQLKHLTKEGLLDESKSHYFLTKRGINLANIVFMEFLD